jgi:transcriptional regulator with XRE-family HTH domain
MPAPRQPEKASARALGSLIRDGRRKAKLSQRQLAAELPMSQAHLSRIELGDHAPPSDAVLLRIAEVLTIDPRELLRAAGRQAAGVTFEAIVLDRLDQLARGLDDLRSTVERIERQLAATAPPAPAASPPKR